MTLRIFLDITHRTKYERLLQQVPLLFEDLFRRLANILDQQSWWERLSQLRSFFFITDLQRVQVSTASDLELDCVVFLFHDFDRFGILSSCCEEKVLDFFDFTSHCFDIALGNS